MGNPAGMWGKSTVLSGNSGRRTGMVASVPSPFAWLGAPAPSRLRRLAVLAVLEDALALGLTRPALVAERDLHADLVLTHQVVADRTTLRRDDVLLGVDSLGLLDGVGHNRSPGKQ